MKSLRVLSIIGIVVASFSFVFASAYAASDPDVAIGWGIIAMIYLLALSIVGTIK